jgi:putative transposase
VKKNTPQEHLGSNVSINDALTEILKKGAQSLLKQAVEVEITEFLAQYAGLKDVQGHRQVVRNGYLPERDLQTGLGDISIQVPRTRDRSGQGIKFASALLPPYLKRTASVENLLPWLYLKGLSSGSFQEALTSLLGPHASGLSSSSICRMKETWEKELGVWQQRDLSQKRYLYFWVDGVYLEARLEQRQCMLVVIGADEGGQKELVALRGGFRESELSWTELLLDLKGRGLTKGPELSIGDGALGFWTALQKTYGTSKKQRCWVHKTANILSKLPQKNQPRAKKMLHEIWMAETTKDATTAFDKFIETHEDVYPKATDCLQKDREALLTFYDFPAAHWHHIRTTNPIESVFATVRLRTDKTKGCLSLETGEAMTFKLIESAQKRWLKLRKPHHMSQIIRGVNFKNGIAIVQDDDLKLNHHQDLQKCAA